VRAQFFVVEEFSKGDDVAAAETLDDGAGFNLVEHLWEVGFVGSGETHETSSR